MTLPFLQSLELSPNPHDLPKIIKSGQLLWVHSTGSHGLICRESVHLSFAIHFSPDSTTDVLWLS